MGGCACPTVNGQSQSDFPVAIDQKTGQHYDTIQAAIDAAADARADFAPQAGSSAGILVLPAGASAVDDAYNNDWVVNMDTTPGNGLVCRKARIKSYVGATRTATLDEPWDFSGESTVAIVDPAVVEVYQDGETLEDLNIDKNLILELNGHSVNKIDVTFQPFCWIRGGEGFVQNGMQHTTQGVLWIDTVTVGARDTTIYAVLGTNDTDLGRLIIQNCKFSGDVEYRRGYMGWEQDNCRNFGVVDANGLVVPYRCVSSMAGVVIVVKQLDCWIFGEFGGAIFYSENNLTGPAAVVNISANITQPDIQTAVGTTQDFFAVSHGLLGATLTMTWGGVSNIKIRWFAAVDVPSGANTGFFSFTRVTNFTGTYNLAPAAQNIKIDVGGAALVHTVLIDGASNMTGTVTLGATNIFYGGFGAMSVGTVGLYGPMTTGSVTVASSMFTTNCNLISIRFGVSQTASTPAITISGAPRILAADFQSYQAFQFGAGVSVSVGTWTISGSIFAANSPFPSTVAALPAAVSGGTWVISGAISIEYGTTIGAIAIASHAGTGGTLTVSSATITLFGKFCTTMTIASATGAGATVNVTAASIKARGVNFSTASTFVNATAATSTATCTGTVQFEECQWVAAITVFNATAASGTAQAPATLTFWNCNFESTFTDRSGVGTLTLATANWQFNSCTFTGLFTATGTSFTTLYWFTCTFKATPVPLTISGTRPTNLTAFKCQGLSDMWLNSNKLEMVDEYFVLSTAVGVTRGDLITMGIGIGKWETCTAHTDIVEGVALTTVGAAAQCIGVVRGRVFVKVDPSVIAKDYCVQDPVVPSEGLAGAPTPGKGSVRTFEGAGATVAGLAYSSVGYF